MKLKEILLITALFLSSCAIDKHKTKSGNPADTDKPVYYDPTLIIKNPQDMLYIHNASSQDFPLYPDFTDPIEVFSGIDDLLYTASGNGGLGVHSEFKQDDNLKLYQGIDIETFGFGAEDAKPEITYTPSGDSTCMHLFSYDPHKRKMLIDSVQIKTLTECTLRVEATLTVKGKTYYDVKETSVVLNPTFAKYADMGDETVEYIKKKFALIFPKSDRIINEIAKSLNNAARTSEGIDLDMRHMDGTTDVHVYDVNALTGLKTLKKLNLSGTELKNVNAIALMSSLETLNLKNCKDIDPNSFRQFRFVKNLKNLNISNIGLKNAKDVSRNFRFLESLDISKNTEIKELNTLAQIDSLRTLNVSDTGLTSLNDLEGLNQVTDLNISNNDLSKATDEDKNILVNLVNVEALDISKTYIPTSMLNDYFKNIRYRRKLTKFVDTVDYSPELLFTEEECEQKIHNYQVLASNLGFISSLQHLDIHGHYCNYKDSLITHLGLIRPRGFEDLVNLKYLDISDNPVEYLDNIARLQNLKTLHITQHPILDADGVTTFKPSEIFMTRARCREHLQKSPNKNLMAECDGLAETAHTVEYEQTGKFTFEVPSGVHQIYVEGCSAGDGTKGTDGDEAIGCTNAPFGTEKCEYKKTAFGQSGEPGKMTQLFSGSMSTIFSSTQNSVRGEEPVLKKAFCQNGGGSSLFPNLATYKVLSQERVEVVPGDILTILLPAGGEGGEAGLVVPNSKFNGLCRGEKKKCVAKHDGRAGGTGVSGYLKITYTSPKTEPRNR